MENRVVSCRNLSREDVAPAEPLPCFPLVGEIGEQKGASGRARCCLELHGSMVLPQGSVVLPCGTMVLPRGSVVLPQAQHAAPQASSYLPSGPGSFLILGETLWATERSPLPQACSTGTGWAVGNILGCLPLLMTSLSLQYASTTASLKRASTTWSSICKCQIQGPLPSFTPCTGPTASSDSGAGLCPHQDTP